MKKINLVVKAMPKATVVANKGLTEVSDNLQKALSKADKAFEIAKKHLNYSNEDLKKIIYSHHDIIEAAESYKQQRSKFFKTYGYVPEKMMKTVSIVGNVHILGADEESLPQKYLSLNKSGMKDLLETLGYVLVPYNVVANQTKELSEKEKVRVSKLKEEVYVAMPMAAFNLYSLLNQKFEVVEKIEVSEKIQGQWDSYKMMLPMLQVMKSEIDNLKKDLKETNKSLDSVKQTMNHGFSQVQKVFDTHQSKLNTIVARVNKNTDELDVLHERHKGKHVTIAEKVFNGTYGYQGYGKELTSGGDFGEPVYEKYYAYPIYNYIEKRVWVEANPTPLISYINNEFKEIVIKDREKSVSPKDLMVQLSFHKIVVGKSDKGVYRIIDDNAIHMSEMASSVLAEVITFEVKE